MSGESSNAAAPAALDVAYIPPKMPDVEEEAIRAVSAVISSSDGDLQPSIELEKRKWQQQLNTTKSKARIMLSDVLSQRDLLRSSLSMAGQLWQVLRPTNVQGEESAETAKSVETARGTHFLATRDQMVMVKALQNVSHTIFLVEFILAAPEALDKAHNSLLKIQKDGLFLVEKGNAALLVEAHAILTAVERLRDVILLDAPNELTASSYSAKCFSRAKDTRKLLEDIVIKGVFSDILEISKSNPRLLVSAARVVEAEENEDTWWRAYLHRCSNAHRGSDVRPYGVLSYKDRALSAVIEALQNIFREKEKELGLSDRLIEESQNAANYSKQPKNKLHSDYPYINVSEVLSWIEDRRLENQTVRRFVIPCIPPSFAFADLYMKELHREFMRLVTRLLHLVRSDGSMVLSESDLIQLITWYGKYQEIAGDHNEPIDSFLTESNRQRLIDALQRHCRDSIDAQVKNAMMTVQEGTVPAQPDTPDIESRHSRPVHGKQGLHRTDLSNVILGFVLEQVKRMMSLKVQGLDFAIATTVAECMQSFQLTVRDKISEERKNSTAEQFGLFVCATANNMARCLECSEDLRELFVSLALDQNRSEIENQLEGIIEGFRSSASVSLHALINGMAENLSTHASRFYAPNTGTEVMLDVVATLEDYFSEYEMYLLPYHFERVVIESLKRIVVWYLAPFLKLSDQRPEEGVARRFTSLPTFDEAVGPPQEDLFEEEDERDIISRRSETDHNGEKRMSRGLCTMNGEAVVAQIDKDISNLTRFMRRKVVLYQKKQLEPTLEPMLAIRSLYNCEPTAAGLSGAFRAAQAVIKRSTRAEWVVDCGVRGQLTARVAEVIWESRKDVNPVTLLEAVTMIRTAGDAGISEGVNAKDRAFENAGWGTRHVERIGDAIANRANDNAEPAVDSLMWSPSPSKLRWKKT